MGRYKSPESSPNSNDPRNALRKLLAGAAAVTAGLVPLSGCAGEQQSEQPEQPVATVTVTASPSETVQSPTPTPEVSSSPSVSEMPTPTESSSVPTTVESSTPTPEGVQFKDKDLAEELKLAARHAALSELDYAENVAQGVAKTETAKLRRYVWTDSISGNEHILSYERSEEKATTEEGKAYTQKILTVTHEITYPDGKKEVIERIFTLPTDEPAPDTMDSDLVSTNITYGEVSQLNESVNNKVIYKVKIDENGAISISGAKNEEDARKLVAEKAGEINTTS